MIKEDTKILLVDDEPDIVEIIRFNLVASLHRKLEISIWEWLVD